MELLISGLALFGIYESESLILSLQYYHKVNSVSTIYLHLQTFVALLWASRLIFLVNLLFHIVIRGFWIGAIGLRYVSGDIDFDNLNYSDRFTRFYKNKIGSYDEYIEKLEKFSSILFSFTFLLFFMLLSFFAFNLFFVIVYNVLDSFLDFGRDNSGLPLALGIFYYGIGLIIFIDFFTLGAFKKIEDKTVSGIYLWIYRFYSTVSLSFFFRPLLLNFIDNKYTRRLFFLALPYTLILFTLSGFYSQRYDYFPSFDPGASYQSHISEASINFVNYDDLRREHYETLSALGKRVSRTKIHRASVNHYEFDHNNLSIFIEYREDDNDLLDSLPTPLDPFKKGGLSHRIFDGHAEDAGISSLITQEVSEIKVINKLMRKGVMSPQDSSLVKRYGDRSGDLSEIKNSIRSHYSQERNDYMKNKISKVKSELLKLAEITIDEKDVKDRLECKFYIHPNMLEKGLLCHFNIDILAYGEHLLRVTKNDRVRRIPFRKIKQNQ